MTTGGLGGKRGKNSCWSRFDIVCSGAGAACLRIICICCCGGSCCGSGGGAKGSQEELLLPGRGGGANGSQELEDAIRGGAAELLDATGAAEELEEAIGAEELEEATGAAELLEEATGAAELLEEATGRTHDFPNCSGPQLRHSAKSDPDQLISDAVRDCCFVSQIPPGPHGV